VEPMQARAGRLETRIGTKVDAGRVDRQALGKACNVIRRAGANPGVLDIYLFACGRFDDVAGVYFGVRLTADQLEVGSAGQDPTAEQRSAGLPASDGNDAPLALRGGAQLLRRPYLDDDACDGFEAGDVESWCHAAKPAAGWQARSRPAACSAWRCLQVPARGSHH